MKKDKKKAMAKEQKKAAKKELTTLIKAALSAVIANFVESNKNIDKAIAKSTKQLVKKLSKAKINLPIVAETPVVVEVIEEKFEVPTKTKKPVKVKS